MRFSFLKGRSRVKSNEVIDSLRFSERWVLLISEFGGVHESKNPSRSWEQVAPALEELQPDAG